MIINLVKPYIENLPGCTLTTSLDKHILKIPDGCWYWRRAVCSKWGYGKYRSGLAHRITYTEVYGEIGHLLEIDHLCRQVRCCNPYHLEAVTPKENSRRRDLFVTKKNRVAA